MDFNRNGRNVFAKFAMKAAMTAILALCVILVPLAVKFSREDARERDV
ncbi:hypothetical protein [Niabella hirudinis]